MKTKSDLTNFIGTTWTLERKAGKVYITHVGGHTVALNDPVYPSAPDFHVPDYVMRIAKRMLRCMLTDGNTTVQLGKKFDLLDALRIRSESGQ